MAKVKTEWRPFQGQYSFGERLYAGKIMVAEAAYNGSRTKGDPKAYRAVVLLTGVKGGTFDGEKLGNVKSAAERAVAEWFRAVGI
jgi:hypothetical protein